MQELAVAIIVTVAALYLAGKYMPLTLRTRIVLGLSKGGRPSALARWLDKAGGGGCGGGGSCSGGGCAAKPDAPGKHRVIKLHQR